MDNGIKINKPRIELIDSMRGFAIAAIFLIHASNHFLFDEFPAEQGNFIDKINDFSRDFLYFIFECKAYTIFALLFGYTFALQMNNYRKKTGNDFGGIMLWRLILLIFIGIFNAAFFAGGDPLVFYALAMMLVLPFRNINQRGLLILSTIFLLQPSEILNSIYGWWGESYIEDYVELNSVLIKGNFIDTVWANITWGLKGCLAWAVETGRFTQTLGLFFLGMLAYKKDVFNNTANWTKYYYVYMLITVGFYFIHKQIIPISVGYYNLFFSLSLVSLFVIIYKKFNHYRIFNLLAIYGRMSLTNFVMQSLLGSLIYYPWGLYLSKYLTISSSLALTIGLIILQIYFSSLWLKTHRRGPLEWIWHRLTYLGGKK